MHKGPDAGNEPLDPYRILTIVVVNARDDLISPLRGWWIRFHPRVRIEIEVAIRMGTATISWTVLPPNGRRASKEHKENERNPHYSAPQCDSSEL
jgi:hypothetical protein